MSAAPRPKLAERLLGSRKEERVDYSEPDFSSWAARLDDYIPVADKATADKATADKPVADKPAKAAVQEAPVAAPATDPTNRRPSLDDILANLLSFDGAMCVALVDSDSGMVMGKAGSGVDIDLAAAGASVMLRARLVSLKAIGLKEKIDDLLISLSSQVQIIHPLPNNPTVFTYLIGDKAKSSLAMARYKAAEADLQIQL